MKIFLDTNVLVSSFITRGLCADLFRIIVAEHELILSDYILTELETVLDQKIKRNALINRSDVSTHF